MFSPLIANILHSVITPIPKYRKLTEQKKKKKRHLLEYIYFNSVLAWFEQRWEYRVLQAVDSQICISETKSWLLNLGARATIHFLPESKMPDQSHRDGKYCHPRNCGRQEGYSPSKYYKYQFSKRVRAPPSNQRSSVSVLEQRSSSLNTQQAA